MKKQGKKGKAKVPTPTLEARVGYLENRLESMQGDLSVIIGTLGDLQDRFEGNGNGQVHYTPTVHVQPSNVTGSPHDYLVIALTPAGVEGSHLLVSDAAEFGEDGICVGKYDHYESEGQSHVIRKPDEAIKFIAELIG